MISGVIPIENGYPTHIAVNSKTNLIYLSYPVKDHPKGNLKGGSLDSTIWIIICAALTGSPGGGVEPSKYCLCFSVVLSWASSPVERAMRRFQPSTRDTK
jgi:hypothetical protein